MFLHNDIYCKHLIEALIKLRNILDQQEMYKTWAFRELLGPEWNWLSTEAMHQPWLAWNFPEKLVLSLWHMGIFHFVLEGAFTVFSSACTESDDENHIL